eukprot:g21622.t1
MQTNITGTGTITACHDIANTNSSRTIRPPQDHCVRHVRCASCIELNDALVLKTVLALNKVQNLEISHWMFSRVWSGFGQDFCVISQVDAGQIHQSTSALAHASRIWRVLSEQI